MENKEAFDEIRAQIKELSDSIRQLSEKQNAQNTDVMLALRKLTETHKESDVFISQNKNDDELFQDAVDIAVQTKQISTSLLQRRLSLGYARAARLVDILEEKGVIEAGSGAKPRKVLITKDDVERVLQGN